MNFLNRLFAKPVIVRATLNNKKHVPPTIERVMTMRNIGKAVVPHSISIEVPEQYHLQFEIENTNQVFVCNKKLFNNYQVGHFYQITYKRSLLSNKIRIVNIVNK